MQLVAYGPEDLYLTGNPDMSYFKRAYQRHTHFSLEAIPQTFNGTFDFGKKVECTVSRNGDLISKTYLVIKLPKVTGQNVRWVPHLGHSIIKKVSLEIGGQLIDSHTGEWMHIWNDLTERNKAGMDLMMCGPDSLQEDTLFIPLQFYFCTDMASALPLICLRFHEVKIKLELRDLSELLVGEPERVGPVEGYLMIDYVYMDTDERRKYAHESHEYLVTQLQTFEFQSDVMDLSINGPCKEIVFISKDDDTSLFDFSNEHGMNPVESARLILKGHDRFQEMPGKYFNVVQPFQHHTNVPAVGINVYSFALHPEARDPSGSCNMTKVETVQLKIKTNPNSARKRTNRVYARTNNVLRITCGMGGLAFNYDNQTLVRSK